MSEGKPLWPAREPGELEALADPDKRLVERFGERAMALWALRDVPGDAWLEAVQITMTLTELGIDHTSEGATARIIKVATQRAADRIARAERYVDAGPFLRHEPVVYYLRMSDRVKIGTSTRLGQRIQDLANSGGVMAVEFGSHPLETQRHHQFAHLRENGEWFRLTEELAGHVVDARERFERDHGLTVDAWLAKHSRQQRRRSLSG